MICDICLLDKETQEVGLYLDEEGVLHTGETSQICQTCLKRIQAEMIGIRKLRRIETASYAYYKNRRQDNE